MLFKRSAAFGVLFRRNFNGGWVMNKVYKVIWSNARKCYVVVSEIAKNHGKNNTKNIVSRLAARMGMYAADGVGHAAGVHCR